MAVGAWREAKLATNSIVTPYEASRETASERDASPMRDTAIIAALLIGIGACGLALVLLFVFAGGGFANP